jgi:hypothetical protein
MTCPICAGNTCLGECEPKIKEQIMARQNNEDLLLNLYKIHAYIPNDAKGNPLTPFGNFCAGYEAAKADSESILQEQQNTIAEIELDYNRLFSDFLELQAQNSELSASINVLREALMDIAKTNASTHGTTQMMLAHCIKSANEALTSTPALKRNEFPNPANLDVYNSVIFSDGSYGTMIMESKIVKWLCRNRAKDYFDEMVEGK